MRSLIYGLIGIFGTDNNIQSDGSFRAKLKLCGTGLVVSRHNSYSYWKKRAEKTATRP